ncbi:sugar phosphate nucleotidyltransferase [Paenibacillus urinalis]|uniref:Sugar phosphate nucleotidyltransferase n=1 Tax=Paenibacillus urinalis TaxID=521520 RepID=A0AAX3N2L4_9BACL|nr:sugar phosphate nucleotidyltransferase [Paenibacillus urinalis]WDH83792.1 sugar phosphate nucleotidyltransferase [Paenibacillus urinalis]
MKLVLLSGGSGKRLWPLSNDIRSKQFLKILDSPNGDKESMVQRVWRQIEEANLKKDTCIATSIGQVEILKNQLNDDIKLIVEPQKKDTFPAIALAATYLYSMEGIGLDETIVILPVDPYVENNFFKIMENLDTVLQNSDVDLALIGVKPSYPSEKYGYIIPEERKKSESYMNVSKFVEKPHKSMAETLIIQNAHWNCGVFAFKLNYLISLLIEKQLPIQYEAMVNLYDSLPAISFDFEVVEKARSVVVIPYDGYWKDLGTWNTLTDEMSSKVNGIGYLTQDSMNTHIINELNIPINVINLSNIVVVASPDGILVCDKDSSSLVKDVIKNNKLRPMYEERRWGNYRVLDYSLSQTGEQVLTKRICIKASRNLSYQYHRLRREIWTVVSGQGELMINNELKVLQQGDLVNIPQNTLHSVKAITDLEIIEVQLGNELVEDDVVRIYMEWEDILLHVLSREGEVI